MGVERDAAAAAGYGPARQRPRFSVGSIVVRVGLRSNDGGGMGQRVWKIGAATVVLVLVAAIAVLATLILTGRGEVPATTSASYLDQSAAPPVTTSAVPVPAGPSPTVSATSTVTLAQPAPKPRPSATVPVVTASLASSETVRSLQRLRTGALAATSMCTKGGWRSRRSRETCTRCSTAAS